MKKKTSNPSADEIENLFRKKAEKLVWNIIDTHDYDDHIIENATLSIQELLEEYASLKQSEWISVEDELPEKAGKYIVHRITCNKTHFATWNGTMFAYNPDVTHWQPLPAPPTNKEQPLDD